jgi:hypothetical protein
MFAGTDVMILKILSPKNLAKILVSFAQTTASFCKNVIITKLAKIAENFDHNIDPLNIVLTFLWRLSVVLAKLQMSFKIFLIHRFFFQASFLSASPVGRDLPCLLMDYRSR